MSACEKNNEHSAVQKLFLMMHQHKVEPDRPPVDVFSFMFFGLFSADIDVFLPACRKHPETQMCNMGTCANSQQNMLTS